MNILITGSHGYIGSVLTRHLLQQGHDVEQNDWRVAPGKNYADLRTEATTVIHLAAHSSVRSCEEDPVGAVENNLLHLAPFIRRLMPGQTFIFASTGSVYDQNTKRLYDATKRAAEVIVPVLHPRSFIVRFGTVCGVSPNMREDVILNGMVRDAVRKGVVSVLNPHAHRPVLFFADLCASIDRLLDPDAVPGLYSLASFQARIGGWADMVANVTGATIVDEGLSPHYDFKMPVLPNGLVTPETVIEELAGWWRAR